MKMLLAALKRIRDKGPTNDDYGICGNVRVLVPRKMRDDIQNRLSCLISRWPQLNCCTITFPVEGYATPYHASRKAKTLWKNPRRIYLLNYLIQELENELARSAEKDS